MKMKKYHLAKKERRQSIQSNTTPDLGVTKHKKTSYTREQRGQLPTRLQGIDKTACLKRKRTGPIDKIG